MVNHDSELCRSRSGADLVRPAEPQIAGGHQNVVLRKLRLLNQARVIGDLRVLPGNRLEALKADRLGQYSIRSNDQWRICFVWDEAGPKHVEIVDHHG